MRPYPSPVVEDAIQPSDVCLGAVWIVDVAAGAGHCPVQDERNGPPRVGRCEEDAHRAALGHADQRRSFRTHRVHDRADVVHPLFERRRADVAVRQPHPPLVEDHQARERRQPLDETIKRGAFEVELQVAGETGDPHQIERTLAHHPIGDAHTACVRVANRRPAIHHSPLAARTAAKVLPRQP
jgi:hypothetical protein